METRNQEAHDMSQDTPRDNADTPSSDDNALMTRLGLLLGDHRVSTVKTQTHPHPVLSHSNHSHTLGYLSSERRKKSHLTTSPASTLSDKGIGSSVGSFDSEFRNNLSVLAENNVYQSRTGSLDSRNIDNIAHSRSDSGIPSHSRSSSDIVLSENNTDITASRLAQQSGEKLWNADPRRNNGNPLPLHPPEVKPRRPLAAKARKNSNSSRDRADSSSDVMKLPQLCLDSPNQSTAPSSRSSVSSSRSVTPAASVCDVTNFRGIKRSFSSHSNGTVVFDSEPLPPPPPPPPAGGPYGGYDDDLPPPPPPPPDEMDSNHSRASSSDRTVSCEDFSQGNLYQQQCDSANGKQLQLNHVVGKPPINRAAYQDRIRRKDENIMSTLTDEENANHSAQRHNGSNENLLVPPVPVPRTHSHNFSQRHDDGAGSMIQRLRSSSDVGKAMRHVPTHDEDGVVRGRPQQKRSDLTSQSALMHLTTSMASMGMERAESSGRISNGDIHVNHPVHHGPTLWDESRPHSLSAPPTNPLVQNLSHRPSASFDNSYFSRLSSNRSSTRSNPSGDRRKPLSNASSSSDMRSVRFAPFRPPDVNLQALQFELPSSVVSESRFIGREWLFGEIITALNNSNSKINKAVVILGSDGRGKTTIIRQLEAYSYHGNKKSGLGSNNSTMTRPEHESVQRVGSMNKSSRSGSPNTRPYQNQSNNSSRTASPALGNPGSRPGSRSGSQTSLSGEEAQKRLASQVVAYHYCQADNNTTCYVPEFLHSIAAQLAQAPQLTAYREMLLSEPHLQNLLSLRSCIQNPNHALHKAILEPLVSLRQTHKLPRLNFVILLDGIGEAEQHSPDHGFTILSFLQRHLREFPDFIKIIATCRKINEELVKSLPAYFISLDIEDNRVNVTRDVQSYISYRISNSKTLSNLAVTGKPDAAVAQKLLSTHLVGKSHGDMLYLRLVLDLIDSGKLIPKSSGFKVVPVNLSEVFLFMCNLKFNSASSFARVRDIFAVGLASLYPLKDEQLHQALCTGFVSNQLPIDEFRHLMESVSQFLVSRRSDGRRSFFHPCFREWLSHNNPDDNLTGTLSSMKKFCVDPKRGHALLATALSRQPSARLNEHAALELAHHLLKARMFRGQSKTTGMNSNDLHSVWMAQCSHHLSESLVTLRNLFYPNMKVSKLLLRSGANPNLRSQVLCDAPALCVVSHMGYTEFVELLLTYGATIDFPASNGMTSLAYASAAGHLKVVELLIKYKPRLDLVDRNGHSPLLHAISHGHNDIATLLLTCQLYVSPEQRKFSALQALIAAATTGNKELIQYLLDHPDVALHCDVNSVDPTRAESALTAAASRGKSSTCEFLIRERRANIEQRNKDGMTPLLCAVKQGEWDTADLLLNLGAMIEGADYVGRTPLITAASCGSLGVVELLLSRGANTTSVDKEGLTALGWACLKGHFHCVRSLIDRGSDIHHSDKHGRTPLDLAAFFGDEQIVELLLDSGADLIQADEHDVGALDRAIGSQNIGVASLLLKRGAYITPTSWKLAIGKPDITTILLGKSVDDANAFYKEERYLEARDVYSTALQHVGEPMVSINDGELNPPSVHGHLRDLTAVLLLGLSRCARKLSNLDTAEAAASRALDLKSGWYEALYVRARVRREMGQLEAALHDVEGAETHAPAHNKKEITRLIERLREEMKREGNRSSSVEPVEVTERTRGNSFSGAIRRQRVNSTSGYRCNQSTSPHPDYQVSRSFQAPSHLTNYDRLEFQHPTVTRHPAQLPHLYPEGQHDGDLRTSHSQDSLTDSRMSLNPSYSEQFSNVPYQHYVRQNHDHQPRRRPIFTHDTRPEFTERNGFNDIPHYQSVRRPDLTQDESMLHDSDSRYNIYSHNAIQTRIGQANSHAPPGTHFGQHKRPSPSGVAQYRRTVATEL